MCAEYVGDFNAAFDDDLDTPAALRTLSALAADLRSIDTTPNYVFITPNLCHDGHDGGRGSRCVDGAPGGLVSADQFVNPYSLYFSFNLCKRATFCGMSPFIIFSH